MAGGARRVSCGCENNDSNVVTGGLGFAPFNRVHLDLMGLYGEDETWGQARSLR